MPAHLIPLLSLAKTLDVNRFNSAFLVPKGFHYDIEKNGFQHLGIDRKGEDKLMPEISAISTFDPDVIVDDLNYFSYFSSRLFNIPRVSVVRKGILPFESYNPAFRHSSDVIDYFTSLGEIEFDDSVIEKPKSISDLFRGKINIIPSIKSIETLPEELSTDSSYVYSGPLLLSDEDMIGSHFSQEMLQSAKKFIEQNSDKKLVYVDLGLFQPDIILNRIEKCFEILFDQPDIAILTNSTKYKCKNESEEQRLFVSDFLPNNLVYSNVDLAIHKCGSGTYNYQVNYQVFSIVLGSNCYDRDEIAMRLETLGVSKYISPNLEDDEYYQLFEESVLKSLNETSNEKKERRNALASIKEEILVTQNEFDFEKILKSTRKKTIRI